MNRNQKSDRILFAAIFTVVIVFFTNMLLNGCTYTQIPKENAPPLSEKPEATTSVSLSWENTTEAHPERKPWSEALIKSLNENWAVFDSAKDIQTFCPKYKSLDKAGRLKAWGELWVGLAYYESGYNPKSASVDVGTKGDKNTWSIGLFQMSVVDQENYKIPMGYDYNDLITPEPNIKLATAIMARQIKNRGVIVVSSSPYWSTLYHGRYDNVDDIADRVKAKAPGCK